MWPGGTIPAFKPYFCLKTKHLQGSVMHLLWYTLNWSTQPQVYINRNDWVPPLVWLHSVYLMLHDITVCDEISHTFSHCVSRYTVAVFEVCIQVQAGRLYHMRDQHRCLSRKRRVWRILVPSWWGKSPRPPWKWSKKIKANAFISFPDEIVSTKMSCFADMNLCKFSLYCHTKLLSFSIGLLETHMNNYMDKKIVPSSHSHCLMLKMWTRVTTWRETEWWVNCRAILSAKTH